MTTSTLTAPAVGQARWQRPRLTTAVVAIVALAAGWFLSGLVSGTSGVALAGEVTGTVSVVNAPGNKVCISPSGGGTDRCSILFQRPNSGTVSVGDHVRVAVAEMDDGPGSRTEAFILESVAP